MSATSLRPSTKPTLHALALAFLAAVASADVAVLTASLDGSQVDPPVATAATGTATVTVDAASGSCHVAGEFSSLSGSPTAVELRSSGGPGGTPVTLMTLAATGASSGTFVGTGTLTGAGVADVQGGLAYVEIATAAHATGEVRGQVLWPILTIDVELDGSQLQPPVASGATASVEVTVDRNSNEVRFDGSYSNLAGVIHDAHIHAPAWFGQNAPHIGHLTFAPATTSGLFGGSEVLSSTQIEAIVRGDAYLLIHTAAFPPGEIRGQVYESPEQSFCPATSNSSGSPASLSASGSPVLSDSNLTLHVTDLPQGTTAMLLNSMAFGVVRSPAAGGTASDGDLCIAGGAIGRHAPVVLGQGTSDFDLNVDLSSIPTPLGGASYSLAALPGDTWLWQCWHRDVSPPAGRNNFSNAIAITFR